MMPCILTEGMPAVVGRGCHCGKCYRSESAGPIDLKAARLMLRSFQITNGRPALAIVSERTYTAIFDELGRCGYLRDGHAPTRTYSGYGMFLEGVKVRVVPGDDDFFMPQAARDPLIFGASA